MNELLVGDKLEATTAITALVGNRIRPGLADFTDAMPLIAYDLQHIELDGGATDGVTDSGAMSIDITCLAAHYLDAMTLRNLIIETMEGWSDDTTNPEIQPSRITSVVYDTDGANPGNDVIRHGFVISLYVPFGDYAPPA